MNRKMTVTYDLPEEICVVLEQRAATEGRRLEEVVAEHVAHSQSRPREMAPQEIKQRAAAFERHFGAWDSGDPRFSENDKIDADLAREYGRRGERGE
jgi:predicted nucleic acid-binding protein